MRKFGIKFALFTVFLTLVVCFTQMNKAYASKLEVGRLNENSVQENVEDEKVDIKGIEKEAVATSADAEEMEINSRIALIYDRASGEKWKQANTDGIYDEDYDSYYCLRECRFDRDSNNKFKGCRNRGLKIGLKKE